MQIITLRSIAKSQRMSITLAWASTSMNQACSIISRAIAILISPIWCCDCSKKVKRSAPIQTIPYGWILAAPTITQERKNSFWRIGRPLKLSEWKIPLSELDYGAEEEAAVLRVLRSKWLSMGPEVQNFER